MRSWKRFCGVVEAIPSGGVVAPGFAVKLSQFLLQRDHDHTTIGPRLLLNLKGIIFPTFPILY